MRGRWNRRDFLGASGAAGALALAPGWLVRAAADAKRSGSGRAAGRVLVVVELRGGNDGLNTVVPVEDELYRKLRPALALKDKDLQPLDATRRFHPSLKGTSRHFAEGRGAIVQGVGYPEPNLSHFESQDIWQSASLQPSLDGLGWLGRWRDGEPEGPGDGRGESGDGGPSDDEMDLEVLSIGTETLPRALMGRGAFAPAVRTLEGFRFRGGAGRESEESAARLAALEALQRAPGATEELAFLQQAFETTSRASRAIVAAAEFKPRGNYASAGPGRDLRAVASILGSGLPTRIFHVVQDGYDTHTDQARTQARLLADLDQSVDALLTDLADLGLLESTLIVTTSEFGRRAAENGSGSEAGTDHGTASVQLLFGGALRGGVLGPSPDLANLDANGNLRAQIDFRQVYASVIDGWLGGNSEAVLGGRFAGLELFRA
jgi:uncharacterized protein (DUF1501 family)